jgi:hypothetical protein
MRKQSCLFKRSKFILVMMVLVVSIAASSAIADDYRWVETNDEDQLIDVDPKICKLYEENLQYYASRNTPMSCYRPIAPHLKDRIKDVEWEDIDPDRYPDLFRTIVIRDQYLVKKSKEVIQQSVNYYRKEIAKKVRVFRRAKLSLVGRIHVDAPSAEPEPYWIVQYGVNDISSNNPEELWRCKPNRGGGFDVSNLSLYIVSETKLEVLSILGTVRNPSREGQLLRLIDDRLFVENVHAKAWIELNEVKTAMPMTDTVCNFEFKKSSNRGK